MQRMSRKGRRREKKREETRQRKEISERAQKERERLIEKKESLARNEEDLNEWETNAGVDLKAPDEILNDATSRLDAALSSTPLNKQSITVAKMMLDTAKSQCHKLWFSWTVSEKSRNL